MAFSNFLEEKFHLAHKVVVAIAKNYATLKKDMELSRDAYRRASSEYGASLDPTKELLKETLENLLDELKSARPPTKRFDSFLAGIIENGK